ncbi:MAG: toll/interleukin-1 receptor domain-containing protein, partial [Clostridia bacterium]|nr:toll/interleukin-1 receptor domain-containing protein [Clostridia bacterium]
MAEMLFKTRGNSSPSGKPRVYFTCHNDDFDLYFEQVCEYIFKSHDCAVYYTADMNKTIDESDKALDLESCNLFVVPVTSALLTIPNRAMDDDIKFALERHIPVLPLMMESGLDAIYSRPDKFGELQYLSPFSSDETEVSFDEKLKKYLESVLVSDKMATRIRAAFDAYIFLSYRKKDRKYANQLMRIIHNKPECRDIAIWYDEFLTPGESFRENIDKILADSKLFTLLVTPNLLEDHNFVMEQEYPAAIKSGIEIIPAEMAETDHDILGEKYADLPEISNPYDDEQFRKRLADTLSRLAITSNDSDPEHNFLIGLAYLDGIDVEVDRERALKLITSAADTELREAMEKLYDMYLNGIGVPLSYIKAVEWGEKILAYNTKKFGETGKFTREWTNSLALLYQKNGQYNKALEMGERLYNIYMKLYGKNDSNTMTAAGNLASYYNSIGNYQKAIRYGEEVYKYRILNFGAENQATLSIVNSLALYYSRVGDFDKAIEYGEKAYNGRLKMLGEKDKYVLTSLGNLASYHNAKGNFKKAIEFCTKAYENTCDILGENHPDSLLLLSNMAAYYNAAGDFRKAIEICAK